MPRRIAVDGPRVHTPEGRGKVIALIGDAVAVLLDDGRVIKIEPEPMTPDEAFEIMIGRGR